MRPAWLRWVWIIPAVFLLAFLVVPLATILGSIWTPDGTAGLLDASAWRIAALAAVQALASTILALAVGLPIANAVSRYRFRGRAFAQALVTIPFVLPTVVVALAFKSLLGPGLAQGFLLVVIAHAYVNLAVVVRIVGARWVQHDDRFETVARALGASPWRAFTSVTWPMLRGSIASAAAVVFIFCFSSLGIVLILGDASTRTLETQILRQTSLLLDFPGAAASAIVQLVLVSTVLGASAWLASRSPAERPTAAALRPLPRHRAGRMAILGTACAAVAIVAAPVLALAAASLTRQGQLSLAWWQALGTIDAGTTRIGSPLAAIGTSLLFAAATGLIAGMIGGMAALALLSHRIGRGVTALALIPLGISAATLGLGTLLAYGRPPLDLRPTGLLVPLAHSLVAIPLVVAVVAPALRATDDRAMHVAATLGASATRAFLTAYGPVLRVVMIAAGGLAAAVSLGEFGAASFLARAGSPTVPIQIVRLLGRPGELSFGTAAALAVVLVALTLTVVLVVDRMARRDLRGAAA